MATQRRFTRLKASRWIEATSRYFDRHSTYVALSRHRERATLYYGEDTFPRSIKALSRALGRERTKDVTLDYAELRGVTTERAKTP